MRGAHRSLPPSITMRNCHFTWEYESALPVLGVDEVGVGPIAGPMAAGAVVLKPGAADHLYGVRDSKKVKERYLEVTAERIRAQCLAWYVGWELPGVVDRNPHQTQIRLLTRCVKTVIEMCGLNSSDLQIVVDGNQELHGLGLPHLALVKGDSRCLEVACASVLAKYSRDQYMRRMACKYPHYDWGKNKGYPTSDHLDLVVKNGVSILHRQRIATKAANRHRDKIKT